MSVWTANSDTFAMSEYPDCPWREPVAIDGELYAISDRGIVAIDADRDEGEAFDSAIEWGDMDFGSEFLKRLSYAYVAYESLDVLFMPIAYNKRGYEESVQYELPYRVADDVLTGRFRLGRGLRSRYFRMGFEAMPGYAFTLYSASLMLDSTSRRI